MATITKEYARGTIIAIQAKASISVGDANLLEYSWFKDGELQETIQTGETATILISTAATYHVVVSHPNADDVRSDDFVVTLRDPKKILRLIYQTGGFEQINSSTGDFTSFEVVDWNIAENQYEFGPGDPENALFGTPASGWWRIFAKEQDLSLDITLRGSPGQKNLDLGVSGEGGVGTLRRTFEQSQLYTFRVGDRRTGSGDDNQGNGPNGGRTFGGGGAFGGGCTYMKRGGTLLAVCGGGGGAATDADGGAGGGLNVAGEKGEGNPRTAAQVTTPGDQINYDGYPRNYTVRRMTRCGSINGSLSCTVELSASDNQNNGGFGDNDGGGGGSGVEGGYGGREKNQGGNGGSGWASSAVTIVSTQLGGNTAGKNGSVRIRETGFNNYQVKWYHTTGVRKGLTPTFQVTNTGNFDATVIPQNVGFETGEGPTTDKHYLVEFAEEYPNTDYNIEFTFVSDLTAAGSYGEHDPKQPRKHYVFDQQKGSFRCKFGDSGMNTPDGRIFPHIREVIFKVTPA
jgi:hypothetical protein